MTQSLGDLRWILDELPIAVWVGNVPDGTVAYANKAFERVLMMPAVASSQINDVPQTYGIFGRDLQPYPLDQLPFARVLATRAPAVVDDMVVRRAERDIYIRAFASPVFTNDGGMSHVIVAFFDINPEMSARRDRELAQERLSFVCNNAPILLWSTDTKGNITLSEGAALKTLGVEPGQLVGQNVFDLYAPHPTIPDYMRRALAGESFWYTAADGDAIFESWLSPLRDEGGAVIGLAGFSNDVSQIRKLQNTVIQNDRVKAVGTLAASVAHEINNPLTYVLAHEDAIVDELDTLEGLLAEVRDPELPAIRACLARIREELAPVRSGTERIATITRDLRSFSRPDDASLSPIDVRTVIDAVLKLMRKEVEARATLVLELTDTPPVMANETRLVQVVMNLIMNALTALPQGVNARQEIRVRSESDGAHVMIEVHDSGGGVPAAERERIFEPFVTSQEIGKGTGLGLFVCRNIVRGLGGDVSVGDSPAGGASFRVTLPAGRPTQPIVSARAGRPLASNVGRHIVLIDDDDLVLNALAAQLKRAGFRVTTFLDGASALAMLTSAKDVDLIYCDMMMKGLTGMDVATTLSAKAPAMGHKLVIMTGGAFSPKTQDFITQRGDRAVTKPFDIVTETRKRLS